MFEIPAWIVAIALYATGRLGSLEGYNTGDYRITAAFGAVYVVHLARMGWDVRQIRRGRRALRDKEAKEGEKRASLEVDEEKR